MKILIFHKNLYDRMRYGAAIDHRTHEVIYVGESKYLQNIPDDVRCEKVLAASDAAVEPAALQWLERAGHVDRIIARHETQISLAAALRERFRVPGMFPAVARNFRDKVAMKSALSKHGIRVPRFGTTAERSAGLTWSGRTVIKPRDGSASQGVRVFDTVDEALEYIGSRPAAERENFELEEYIDGELWYVDGFIYGAEAVAVQTARYLGSCLGFLNGQPLGCFHQHNPELARWAVRCVKLLGAYNTTFHLEAFVTAEGPVFLEVAARAGGGYTVALFERARGIHLHTLDVASDVEGKLASRFVHSPEAGLVCGEFMFPGHMYTSGKVQVSPPASFFSDPSVLEYKLQTSWSFTSTPNYRPENQPFSGMVTGTSASQLEAWLQDLFRHTVVRPLTEHVAAGDHVPRER